MTIDRLGRGHRGNRIVAVQIRIELTIGKSVPDSVRPMHGEGCLTDARRTDDQRHRQIGRLIAVVTIVAREYRVEARHFAYAVDEPVDVAGELGREWLCGGRRRVGLTAIDS